MNNDPFDTVGEIFERRMIGEFTTPPFVNDVLAELIDDSYETIPQQVLIPYARIDITTLLSLTKLDQSLITFLSPLMPLPLTENMKVETWKTESELESFLENGPKYDLILSDPPFGYNRMLRFKVGDVVVSRIHVPEGVFLRSLFRLSENGKAFLVTPDSIYRATGFTKLLDALGLRVSVSLALPANSYPHTAIHANILCIERAHGTRAMLAINLPSVEQKQAVMNDIKNYRKHGTTKLGYEVNPDEYTGYTALEKRLTFERQIKRAGYPVQNILSAELCEEIAQVDDSKDETNVNSIYIPRLGKSPVLANISDSNLKNMKNYYRASFVVGAPINNEYAARYLNSYLGQLIRESKFVGGTIPSLRLETLRSEGLRIPLPSLVEQNEIVGLYRELTAIGDKVAEYQQRLWNFPITHTKIAHDAKELIQKAPEDGWIETLPYPLASILKRFYNEHDSNKRYYLALHFFEALSELLTAIHLGAYTAQPELYQQFIAKTEVGAKLRSVIDKSTFGGWILFLNDSNKFIKRGLTKSSQTKTDDTETSEGELLKTAFGVFSTVYLEALTNATITNILEQAKTLRNSSTGHGPYVTMPAALHEKALQLLAEIRKPLLAIFENTTIITYESSENLSERTIKYRVKALKGSNPILPSIELELNPSTLLTLGNIYIYSEVEGSIRKVLPLVRMDSLPDEKKVAFYFYNSKNKWKSYEFETEVEHDTINLFEELETK